MTNVRNLIPKEGIQLANYSGKDLINRLGEEIIENVVLSILNGSNIRDLTKGLTQRRILLMNASLVVTFLKSLASFENFAGNLTSIVAGELKTKGLKANEKRYLYWFLGLTGKSIQNVVRDNEGFATYLSALDHNLAEISRDVEERYGKLNIAIKDESATYLMNWPSLLRCLLAIGAQTLTIRGSEKSMYGKLFEKFTLGAVLSILGFEYINQGNSQKDRMVFWLSERKDKRESDATVILRPGAGVRFDIGFIGVGNTEISLDKVSRFERVMERGDQTYFTTTIILVDKIGGGSRIEAMAQNIGGHIIQMSGTYWVYELAHLLKEKFPFYRSPILSKTKEGSLEYMKKNIHGIDLSSFVGSMDIDE